MIDKKVLLLTAAMVPMLGLADVGATSEESNDVPILYAKSARHKQHIQSKAFVVQVYDDEMNLKKIHCFYNHAKQSITIDESLVQYSLNGPVPQVFPCSVSEENDDKALRDKTRKVSWYPFGKDGNLGDYLRTYHVKESLELGLYNGLLEKQLPEYMFTKIFKAMHFSHLLPWNKLPVNWRDFLLGGCDDFRGKDQIYIEKYISGWLDQPISLMFLTNYCETMSMSIHKYYSFDDVKDLTLREFLIYTADYKNRRDSSEELKLLCNPVLDRNIPQSIFVYKLIARDMLSRQNCEQNKYTLTWRDYICYSMPKIAESLKLYTSQFLMSKVPNILVDAEELKGLTWAKFLLHHNKRALPPSESTLDLCRDICK